MSRLNKLISELCPTGVPRIPISELGTLSRGKRFVHADAVKEGIPCIHYGELYTYYGISTESTKSFVRLDLADKLRYAKKNDVIIVGAGENDTDIGIAVAYLGEEKVAVHDACYIFSQKNDPKYISYCLRTEDYHNQIKKYVSSGKICAISAEGIGRALIPIPPLEVQREIVRILDGFIELSDVLKEELKLRNQQYQGCSRQLFESIHNSSQRYELWQLCDVVKGTSPIQKTNPGEYPLVVTTSERKSSESYQFDTEAVCIPLVSSRGHGVASLNHVYYQEGKFALGNILCAVIPLDSSVLSAKYLYYYFEESKDYSLVPLMKGGANVSLRIEDIQKIKIPVPSFEIQMKIVHSLDTFDEMCNSQFTGLPAEIQARQQQYCHYRDQLLTFTTTEQ